MTPSVNHPAPRGGVVHSAAFAKCESKLSRLAHCCARIKRIALSRQKGVPRENVDQCALIENMGIEGDRFARPDSTRQLSMASGDALDADTFCLKRFEPNFVTDGLDYCFLKAGQLIGISDCVLELTEIGKQCHEECSETSHCRLALNCAWARVIKGGTVNVGSLIQEARH